MLKKKILSYVNFLLKVELSLFWQHVTASIQIKVYIYRIYEFIDWLLALIRKYKYIKKTVHFSTLSFFCYTQLCDALFKFNSNVVYSLIQLSDPNKKLATVCLYVTFIYTYFVYINNSNMWAFVRHEKISEIELNEPKWWRQFFYPYILYL